MYLERKRFDLRSLLVLIAYGINMLTNPGFQRADASDLWLYRQAFVKVIMHVCSWSNVSHRVLELKVASTYRNLGNCLIVEQLKPRRYRRRLVFEAGCDICGVFPVHGGNQCCHLCHGQAVRRFSMDLR